MSDLEKEWNIECDKVESLRAEIIGIQDDCYNMVIEMKRSLDLILKEMERVSNAGIKSGCSQARLQSLSVRFEKEYKESKCKPTNIE